MTGDERQKIHNEVNSYCSKEIINKNENETITKFYLHTNISKYECLALYINYECIIELRLMNNFNVKSNIKISLDKFKEIFIKNNLF